MAKEGLSNNCQLTIENSQLDRLWAAFAADRSNLDLRREIAGHYLQLVERRAKALAARLPATAASVEDLRSEGFLGLLKSVSRFDPARRIKFETFALPRIRGAMLDSLRDADHVSRLTRQRERAVQAARDELRSGCGPASDEEVRAHLGWDAQTFEDAAHPRPVASSLDQILEVRDSNAEHGRDMSAHQLLVDRRQAAPESGVARQLFFERITRGLDLDAKTLLYLYHYKGQTLKVIGSVLDLSEARMSQMHQVVTARLRGQLDRFDVFAQLPSHHHQHGEAA